jgi:hypothetical protein
MLGVYMLGGHLTMYAHMYVCDTLIVCMRMTSNVL